MMHGFPILRAWILFAMAMLLAAPCSGAKEIVIQMWGLPEIDSFAGWHGVLADYEKTHPGIKIQTGSPGGQLQGVDPQKLMTACAAGTPPDLLWMDRFALAGWASRGVILPVDDLMARDHVDRNDFYPSSLQESMYEGKTYGIPWDTDSRALWCNMDLLHAAGYENPPDTWDQLKEMTLKLTTKTPEGKYKVVGFGPMFGNAWLYFYGWANGGEFMSKDGRHVTLADPKIVEALQWMTDCYNEIGGAAALADFLAAAQGEGVADPFRTGHLAMQITENSGLDYIAKFTPNLNFRAVAPPSPAGRPKISWSGGYCWSIPKKAANAAAAWDLARYLCTVDAWRKFGEYQMAANRKKADSVGSKEKAFYVPRLSASRKNNAMQIAVLKKLLPPKVAAAFEEHVKLLDVCRFRPVTPVGQQLWDEQARATNNAIYGTMTPAAALAYGQRVTQNVLDKYFTPNPNSPIDLWKTFVVTFGSILLLCAALWAWAASRWKWTSRSRKEALAGLLFASPWLVGFIVLMFGPMVASLLIALTEYNVLKPAHFVGFANFANLTGTVTHDGHTVASDPLFWKSLRNTGLITLIGVPLGLAVSLAMALLVNMEIRGVRLYRTLLYLPVVVPGVAGAVLWLWLLNNDTGMSGAVLTPILRRLGLPNVSFFGDPKFMLAGVILLVLWASGGAMVILLAGLKNIPRSYYEAASMDGAGPWQKFLNVTLPMLSPYLFFNLIMGVIGWLQIFVQPYVFITPPGYGPGDAMLYYMIYLFSQGFYYFNMGIACAMAWILFLIVAMLTLFQFKIAPRWVHYET
jgi:multiple sugar transport system permease protein